MAPPPPSECTYLSARRIAFRTRRKAPLMLPLQTSSSDALRHAWKMQTIANGWAYPSDWRRESVDAVCDALVDGRDPWAAAERLGRDRAAAGVGLPEVLADIDALVGLVDVRFTEELRRAVSLGWSERATAPQTAIIDPLTGLASAGYLQVRLGEIYQAADAGSGSANSSHALVAIRINVSAHGLGRRLPMVVVADSVRSVFHSGESVAVLSDSMLLVLTERDDRLAKRAALAQTFAERALGADAQVGPTPVRVWVESLPPSLDMARLLLDELSR